jgi:hypothetical protein
VVIRGVLYQGVQGLRGTVSVHGNKLSIRFPTSKEMLSLARLKVLAKIAASIRFPRRPEADASGS